MGALLCYMLCCFVAVYCAGPGLIVTMGTCMILCIGVCFYCVYVSSAGIIVTLGA